PAQELRRPTGGGPAARWRGRQELAGRTLPSAATTDRPTERMAPHELGLQHRARLPGAAGLDERVCPPRDLAARDDLAGARPGRAARGDGPAAAAGQGARPVGDAPAPLARRTGDGPGAAVPHARDT